MDRWNGKVAVVTGASAGIGCAIVQKLVENGLKVVGLARRQEKLNQLEAKVKNKKGKFFGRKTDITEKNDIMAAFKWINDNVGPISLLVNNAGITVADPIIYGNVDAWKKIFDTNVYGLTVATTLALQNMKENSIEDGHIININSIAGHSIPIAINQNVYPASKFAVTGFTETVRKELAYLKSKIKITSISPGLVDTDIFETSGFVKDPMFQAFFKTAPIISGEDVADAVLYVVGTPAHVQISELTIKPVGELM